MLQEQPLGWKNSPLKKQLEELERLGSPLQLVLAELYREAPPVYLLKNPQQGHDITSCEV